LYKLIGTRVNGCALCRWAWHCDPSCRWISGS